MKKKKLEVKGIEMKNKNKEKKRYEESKEGREE